MNRSVRLHELSVRADGARDLVVGRIDTGDFVRVPLVAGRIIELLTAGVGVAEIGHRVRAETGDDVDVEDFVVALCDLGFVAALDGEPLPSQPAVPRPSLRWLRAGHVRWLLHPVTALGVAALVLAGAMAVLRDHGLVPRSGDLIWTQSGSVVLVGNAIIAWLIVGLHELAHLATARAAGVPARITLGTRLQFLVAQTDVSGIWARLCRVRVTVYLAGIALELVLASGSLLIVDITGCGGLARRLLLDVALIALSSLPFQFLVFLRTDLYFVLQDLTGCANLYRDGIGYLGHLLRRRPDPTLGLPGRQRRAIRCYSVLLVIGTPLCVLVAAVITVPAVIELLGHAVVLLVGHASATNVLDGATTLLIVGFPQALWLWAWRRQRCRRR